MIRTMKWVIYGKQHLDIIILLHGGGLSWWNYREEAELLSNKYQVILPILDGHAGSDRCFTTIQDQATALINEIDVHCHGHVLCIGGLSLGAQVLLEMLQKRPDICRCAFVESALIIQNRVLYYMIPPVFGMSYGLIQKRWFAKLQCKSLRIRPSLFKKYYHDTCKIEKEDMIAFLQENAIYKPTEALSKVTAKVCIFVGEKEKKVMQHSAALLHEMLPNSSLCILPDLYHGEFSLNHGHVYAEALTAVLQSLAM